MLSQVANVPLFESQAVQKQEARRNHICEQHISQRKEGTHKGSMEEWYASRWRWQVGTNAATKKVWVLERKAASQQSPSDRLG
jgi:hypothetical protein